jgi:hypothetical protein
MQVVVELIRVFNGEREREREREEMRVAGNTKQREKENGSVQRERCNGYTTPC